MAAPDLSLMSELLSDRTRLAIMVSLAAAAGSVAFRVLEAELQLTAGNLSTHLRRLEEAGLVTARKTFVDRKPLSTYSCTEAGRDEIERHLAAIEACLVAATRGRRRP